jgi:hypothetical protein
MPITRQDIAAQLDQLDGITGLVTPPRTPVPGQGWPEWRQTVPATMTGDETTWDVHVTLPNANLDATVTEADPLIGAIMDALYPLGEIQSVQPETHTLQAQGAQGLPCIVTTLTTV